ncbi:unnamed protein product [Lymnaea stagnalis]|uniref:FYVE, RhoGEF and PH domain-containing protein 6 n=1 Tax=Lymnaea stagnalis TaxID=6523 RepID=A0AAV2HC05_LYMST
MASYPTRKTGNNTTITRTSNIPVNKSQNEQSRSPEKPPVASKPKIAPPPPPKPTSLSPQSSLTSSFPQSDQKNPCILSYNSRNGLSSETKDNKCKSYDQCGHGGDQLINASSIPPPLPTSPPSLVSQHSLENSTSFSLPASFRSKTLRMVNLSAQSQILVSLSSSSSPISPTSPISSSCSTLDPSLSTRPQGSLRSPKISTTSLSEQEALLLKPLPNKSLTASLPGPTKTKSEISLLHTKEAVAISEAELIQNEVTSKAGEKQSPTQLNNNAQISDQSNAILDTPSLKMPHSCPNKPASPSNRSPPFERPKRTPPSLGKLVSAPSQPVPQFVEKKTSLPPSRPAPPVLKPKSSTFVDSPLESSQQPLAAPDIKFGTEVKSTPPPLPKNPPRGGVPRKPRSSTCKKTPTSEIKPVFPGFQTIDGASDQTSLSPDPSLETDLAPDLTKNNCPQSVIAATATQDNSDSLKAAGPKVAPKPRPRTRLSLPLASKSEQTLRDQSNNNISKDLSNDIGVDQATNDIKSHIEDECKTPSRQPVELDYVEVYRGDSEDRDLTGSAQRLDNDINSRITDLKYSKINFGKSAISDSSLEKTTPLEQEVDANKCNSETFDVDTSSVLCEAKDREGQEPEATCGMLKEIEELLKAKLGDLKLDPGGQDVKQTDSNPETLSRDSPSSSPVRPPRPKRQASICRRKNTGSLESLTSSLDTSSSECIHTSGLSTGGKKIPPKPKRTFVSRVNRSHSDVSGMKPGLGDTEDNIATDMNQNTPTTKPFLPPRLDSLKRSESCSSTVTPPPLPPRNKTQSMIQSPGGSSEGQRLSAADAETPVTRRTHLWDHEHNLDMSVVSGHSGTLRSSKVRPMRKAPPPPPGPPKRSSTFSPGDVKLQDNKDIREKETSSGRRFSIPDDHDYHEISDHLRVKREEGSPPPELPPRVSTFQSPEVSSPDVARHEKSPSPEGGRIVLAKRLSPEDQRLREKRAKTALIQKVAQGLGLSKTSKKIKTAEINPPDTVSFNRNDHARGSSGTIDLMSRESVIPEISAVPEVTIQDDTDSIPSTDQTKGDSGNNSVQALTSGSTSSSDRPPSTVSQHSSNSEVDGELQVFGSQNLEEMLTSGSESEPEPEPDKEEIYAQRKAKKVFFIAREIMSSESTFVDVLKLLNLDFRVHISNATEKLGQPVIPSETLNKILDFLPQLQNFNEELLKDFKECIENWDVKPRISDVFVRKGPFLKLYSSYISNFENATGMLENATKKHPAFAAALKEFEMSSRCASLALKHYMLKPIQRIPQYKLLLQDYLKNLSPASPDYKDTLTALDIVSKVADHANESMRHGDNVQKLLEIQRSLIGQFEVIQPGRILIKKGELQKVSRKEMQPRMFILFNDVLLYTTPTATGYKINNILPLIGMKVTSPKLEDYKYEFSIIGVQRSFTLCTSTPKEKEEWVKALQLAIETNAKKQHTFEAVKQGQVCDDSLLDKNFILGTKAPLWVPDSRVTMCTLCLVEFTLTWRRHHCRSCGRIICSQCSDNKAPLRYLQNKPARVCDQCFETLKQELKKELEETARKPSSSSSQTSDDPTSPKGTPQELSDGATVDDGGSISNLLSMFQKIRINKTKPNVQSRPSVLKEVHANDEGSALSGYLRAYKSRKWKRLWFVVKGQVLYTYRASEDMAAVESMPLLGYEVTRLNAAFEGAEPDLLFELTHQNNQPLGNRNLGAEKTTQRLIFRTDTVAATIKWVSVLTEASCTHLT